MLISTKISLPFGDGSAYAGSSRHRLIGAVEASLRRLGTDYIDLLQLHAFDASTLTRPTISLSPEQIAKLDAASAVMPPYPYYPYRTQEGFARINPPPV